MKRILLSTLLILFWITALSQKKKNTETQQPLPTATGIGAKVAGMKYYPGFVDYYYDEKQDKLYLSISQFDVEFLYVNSLPAGVGSNDIGLDRGKLGYERVVKFERRGPKVLLTQPNYDYRAITTDAFERKSVEEAFAQSVIWGFTVSAEENGKILVDATDFFIRDGYDVSGTLRNMKEGNFSIDKSRSAFYQPRMKNFPENTEVEATITLTGQPTGRHLWTVTPMPESLTVRQHHSFVKLPDEKYHPRNFDPRAGYFGISYSDYATPISEPITRRYICRHRLEKKDPTAARSEPVEPIVYYLDRGTPEPIRSALMDGARWWNQAFEAAGYVNAFRVELMPEDADPMDVRYNLIQWVHRSTRGWSYGSSVIDPRTGEIIKGHVSLGSLRVRQDFLIAEGLLAPYEDGAGVPPAMQEMALARLRQLAAHEVGHTLGIAHSYASSTESLASVMDYPQPYVQVANGKLDLSKAYDSRIGAWDKVAVTYGYQDFPEGTNEAAALDKILMDAIESGLSFLSDQDARPQGGSHPYAHLWDNGDEVTKELNRMMEVRAIALKQFGEHNIREHMPMATLEEALVPIYFYHRYQTEATSKLIGGLEYRYALRGDGQLITRYVSTQQQMAAMDALLKTVSPEALALPSALISKIPPHPMGYPRSREVIDGRTDLTFDPLAYAEAASDMVFSLVLHPARATRLVQHHAIDPTQPSLSGVLNRMINQTIKGKNRGSYEGLVQMTVNLSLLNNLIKLAVDEDASGQARALAHHELESLKDWLAGRTVAGNDDYAAHLSWMHARIEQYLDDPEEFKTEKVVAAPPGQPIGADDFCGW